MNKAELETIALNCLERMKMDAKAAQQSQDEKIRSLETKVTDYESQLTRLSGLYQRLESLVRNLDSILTGNGRR